MYKSELFTCWQEGFMPRDVLLGKKTKKKNNCPGDVAMALTMSGWVNSGRERKNALLVSTNWIRNNDKTKCKLDQKQ